ncbi:sugar isomerase domain-containing protein [Georgenia sp. Z1491]|uniref:sugar isomerase domain-containing protein n=1 Tax=Georgenia sp. Z1491 TaxID=3416707 RepID=UPI003CFA343A
MLEKYLDYVTGMLGRVVESNAEVLPRVIDETARRVTEDRLIYVYGPGGHANIASQEAFFRAGGLMNISAILDEGTMLSSGARRSMAMERTPGYGRVVIDHSGLGEGDLILIVNSYGMNSAVVDSTLRAKELGATVVGVSSREHAETIGPDHPARHPSKQNLHDLADLFLDSHVPVGDAVVSFDADVPNAGAVSTFANAFLMNAIQMLTIERVLADGGRPAVWTSGNAPGGDEANARLVDRFTGRIKLL